jgi:hypothetical protein
MASSTPPDRTPEPHPCPRADPPPTAEECGDRGTYSQPWWQGSIFSYWWQAVLIVLAIFAARFILMRIVGPMLSP